MKAIVSMLLVLTSTAWADFMPGQRVLLDAHNCYPYQGKWADRVTRALKTGTPLGIEMDLVWYTDPATKTSRVLVAHGSPFDGKEPLLKDYFFETVRPIVEEALKRGNDGTWPLITLNINDLRGSDPAFFAAVWDLMGEYEPWLCTAAKTDNPDTLAPIDIKPVLVLTQGSKNAVETFYERVSVGGKLRLFGCGSPDKKATNFLRWVNYAWGDVEKGGQKKAGDWTPEENARLKSLVDSAHAQGYWIRFYTLDGLEPLLALASGWGPGYNLGSLDAVKIRWKASKDAGVDFIASDQYEELSAFLKE